MKPLRKHVALAVDGGGMKGVIAARALAVLEENLQTPASEIFKLLAGTSTGAIISAGIATGLFGSEIVGLYAELGETLFKPSWRTFFWPLTRYKYPLEPLQSALEKHLGSRKIRDFWYGSHSCDIVITAFDLIENKTLFLKPYKTSQPSSSWSLVKAVLASSSVPTVFPAVEDRYVDGGVGSYHNPCYVAAYEARYMLNWDPVETTLISLATGRAPHQLGADQIRRFWPWHWINPILGAFQESADDQQVHLVDTFFKDLDFRRFQVNLKEPIALDDPEPLSIMVEYGNQLGKMILQDQYDRAMDIQPRQPASALS